jgi:hypothetical protein
MASSKGSKPGRPRATAAPRKTAAKPKTRAKAKTADEAKAAGKETAAAAAPTGANALPERDLLRTIGRGVVPPVLHDAELRHQMGLPREEDKPGRYMIELNIMYRGGLRKASEAFIALCDKALGPAFKQERPSRPTQRTGRTPPPAPELPGQ